MFFKIFFLFSLFLGSIFFSYASPVEEEYPPSIHSLSRSLDSLFSEKEIREQLYPAVPAQIHFFWTTGFRPEWVEAQNLPNANVQIGGEQWAPLFFPGLRSFLTHISSAKKVIFVTDTITFTSNQDEINKLSREFPDKFHNLDWDTHVTPLMEERFFRKCPR